MTRGLDAFLGFLMFVAFSAVFALWEFWPRKQEPDPEADSTAKQLVTRLRSWWAVRRELRRSRRAARLRADALEALRLTGRGTP